MVIPFNEIQTAERILEAHASELAAVLFDPIPNRIGMISPKPEFVDMLRRFTERHGILLVFDEVIAFRTGYSGQQGVLGVTPDLTVLGKLIGGGFPVGAVVGRADVMAVFAGDGSRAALPHGGTFNGNPVTMVAGAACLGLLTETTIKRLNELGARARQLLGEAIRASGRPGQVTGQGSLFRLHLHDRPLETYRDAYPSPPEAAAMAALQRHLINEGVFVTPSLMGCLSTPMGETELERLAEGVLSGLQSLEVSG